MPAINRVAKMLRADALAALPKLTQDTGKPVEQKATGAYDVTSKMLNYGIERTSKGTSEMSNDCKALQKQEVTREESRFAKPFSPVRISPPPVLSSLSKQITAAAETPLSIQK